MARKPKKVSKSAFIHWISYEHILKRIQSHFSCETRYSNTHDVGLVFQPQLPAI